MAKSQLPIYGAVAANIAIAVSKVLVAGITGSSVMLSEGVHSTVDTLNDVLLLVGVEFSKRSPTQQHPFGHGKELYFWSLIAAVFIFGLGGGVSTYEGILHILDPEPIKDVKWSYIVIGIATLFEGSSFLIALRHFLSEHAETSTMRQMVRDNRDPSTLTILAEDGAALIGLAIAAFATYLSQRLAMPVIDGVASVLIGLLLCGVAVLLIRQSRGLLVGEGIRAETIAAIRGIAQGHPEVHRVGPILGMYLGADDILLAFDVEFHPETAASDVARAVDTIEKGIRAAYPKITRIYIEARTFGAAVRTDSAAVGSQSG
ncbi:MAG: Cation diffusion facilitator family transporter [Herbaspirillum sp.]|nr:Cation diffusion facilitator family transporter [Herbaspirillum sp.]